jgi:diguanylate cyclase with GGDEF domain/PAS domain-containing protein
MPFEYSEILELSPLGIVVCDDHQRILWCNSRFLEDTCFDEKAVIGCLYASLPLEAIDKKAQLVQQFDDTSKNAKQYRYWQAELTKGEGVSVHYFALNREPSQSSVNSIKLPKRPNWVEFLEYEVSRSRRYDNPLCLLKLHILIDHRPDDLEEQAVWQTVKDTLSDELRWADMIGNTREGSFLMVLPETPPSSLDQLKKKISTAVQSQLKFLCPQLTANVVFGSSTWEKHDDGQKMLQRARTALVEELEKIM